MAVPFLSEAHGERGGAWRKDAWIHRATGSAATKRVLTRWVRTRMAVPFWRRRRGEWGRRPWQKDAMIHRALNGVGGHRRRSNPLGKDWDGGAIWSEAHEKEEGLAERRHDPQSNGVGGHRRRSNPLGKD